MRKYKKKNKQQRVVIYFSSTVTNSINQYANTNVAVAKSHGTPAAMKNIINSFRRLPV